MNSRQKRLTALFLAAVVIVTAVFIAVSSDHVCSSEGCGICLAVEAAVRTLSLFASSVLLTGAIRSVFDVTKAAASVPTALKWATPTELKVKSNS